MTGWNFPSNGGGAINGIADAGVQIFAGKEIPSLARETCQNSLDAAAHENTAVNVEFERYEISPKDIPGVREYEKFLRACRTFWKGNVKAEAFITDALLKLKYAATSVLRISDFHTTGLAEPFDARSMRGWNTLTKINGGTTKSDVKAGNFGIGKNAPFANSFFRMVFYRTLNQRWERAAQAVTKLVSFNLDDQTIAAGTATTAIRTAVCPSRAFPRLKKFISARAEAPTFSFTVSTAKTTGQTNLLARWLKIFSSPFTATTCKSRFSGNTLIVRKNGMKLFELDRFPRALNFTAILELEGYDLNAFFRETETPDHTNWEPSRHPTRRKDTTKYLAELKRWVRNTIPTLEKLTTTPDDSTTKIYEPPPGQSDKVYCDKLRVIKIGRRTYRLIVNVPQTIESGRIEISALGESNTGERLSVTQAKSVDLKSAVPSASGEINFTNLRGKVDANIIFELPQDRHYALEVAVYEN